MIEKLEKVKKGYVIVAFFLGLLISGFMFLHDSLNKINSISDTLKTTQQMSLKSVIWNKDIPLAERATACDIYLNAGYNSLTKKECSVIIDEATEQGLF